MIFIKDKEVSDKEEEWKLIAVNLLALSNELYEFAKAFKNGKE